MAEGLEDAESNNNTTSGEQAVMLGAVMPCEMTSPTIVGLKRELEIVAATAALNASSQGATTPTLQQQPINLKSEVSNLSNFSNHILVFHSTFDVVIVPKNFLQV